MRNKKLEEIRNKFKSKPFWYKLKVYTKLEYYCLKVRIIGLFKPTIKSNPNVKTIPRKGKTLFVKEMMVDDLERTKCSAKFLSHNFNDDVLVNVKCYEDGTLDLRGKKEEYRIIVSDENR